MFAFLLGVFLLPLPAQASASCPRELEQKRLKSETSVQGQTASLTKLTGRHLSATQIFERNTAQIMDHFLLLGDVDPLLNLYQGTVRSVEMAYLQLQNNLLLLEDLRKVKEPASKMRLESAGFHQGADAEAFRKKLEKENLAHSHLLGRLFDEFKAIRSHPRGLITGTEEFLLQRIAHADNREAPRAALEMVATKARPSAPINLIEQAHAEDERAVNSRKDTLGERIRIVNQLLWKVGAGGNLAPELLEDLRSTEDLSDASRGALASEAIDDRMRKRLQSELELRRERLQDAREVLPLALKLDSDLGVKPRDIELRKLLLPENPPRPTVEDIEKVVDFSPEARAARVHRARWMQVWEFIDGNLLYGNVGAAVPALGRFADSVHAPFLRNFIYRLFQDLYLQHAQNQYFPSLHLLSHSKGSPQKLRRQMEDLNAGTKDELLLVFARRSDLSGLWQTLKREAEKDKETDHQKLYDRMVAVEAKAVELGPISLINGGSYKRYLVAGVLNGAVLFAASKWWLVPGGQALWQAVVGKADNPPRRGFWRLFSSLFSEAFAHSGEIERLELFGFDAAVEEAILADFEQLIQSRQPEAAAERLLQWEERLRGKAVPRRRE